MNYKPLLVVVAAVLLFWFLLADSRPQTPQTEREAVDEEKHKQLETSHGVDTAKRKRGGSVPEMILFATVPRSGNTWTRQMLEASTGEPTMSLYKEKDSSPFDVDGFRAYRKRCGFSGVTCSIRTHNSTEVVAPVFKSHHPFLTSDKFEAVWSGILNSTTVSSQVADGDVKKSAVEPREMVVLRIVRHPMTSFPAWCDYLKKRSTKKKRKCLSEEDYLRRWAWHEKTWEMDYAQRFDSIIRVFVNETVVESPGTPSSIEISDIPHEWSVKMVVARYEDILASPTVILGKILTYTGLRSAFDVTTADVQRALTMFPVVETNRFVSTNDTVERIALQIPRWSKLREPFGECMKKYRYA